MKRIRMAVLSAVALAGGALLSPAWADTPQAQDLTQIAAAGALDPMAPVRKLYPDLLTTVGSYGGCGQMCRTTSGSSWNCPSGMHRPYFYDDGDCRCIYMKGKEPRCD